MQLLPTYWQSPDGEILSEDKLIAQVLSGAFAGQVLVLEDYKSHGAALSFRQEGLKVFRYDDWIAGVVAAILDGTSPRAYLRELFQAHDAVCLPDLDLLGYKKDTSELLARAVLDCAPTTKIVLLGDQLTLQAPYLMQMLEGYALRYTICGDQTAKNPGNTPEGENHDL